VPKDKTKKQPENSPVPTPKKTKSYSAVQQPFSAKETELWRQYGILPETLKAYKVFSLREFRNKQDPAKHYQETFVPFQAHYFAL
jgi:hypothetical protein